mmetsp:Transcript_121074/g.342571  ORF Transcript_121074/g.342571 Transcript_121074/m.342571 type:complete len:278 (+) Transcript_121074:79-912(+)
MLAIRAAVDVTSPSAHTLHCVQNGRNYRRCQGPCSACAANATAHSRPCARSFLSSEFSRSQSRSLPSSKANDLLRSSSMSVSRFSMRCIGIMNKKNRECAPCMYFMASPASIQRSKRQNFQAGPKSWYALKKCTISSKKCAGTFPMSFHSFIRGSDFGTPIIFMSGPISSMHSAAPTTRISATEPLRRGTVDKITTSTGFPSSATVCGMKPQFPGQNVEVFNGPSHFIRPASRSKRYLLKECFDASTTAGYMRSSGLPFVAAASHGRHQRFGLLWIS